MGLSVQSASLGDSTTAESLASTGITVMVVVEVCLVSLVDEDRNCDEDSPQQSSRFPDQMAV